MYWLANKEGSMSRTSKRQASALVATGCISVLAFTAVASYAIVSNQNNDNNFNNQQSVSMMQAQPLPADQQCSTYGPGWIGASANAMTPITWGQVCSQPDGSYVAGIKLLDGSVITLYSSDGFMFCVNKNCQPY
jgi:hypothetical protein